MLEIIRDEVFKRHNELIEKVENRVNFLKSEVTVSGNYDHIKNTIDEIDLIEKRVSSLENYLPTDDTLDGFTQSLRWWLDYAECLESYIK